MSGSQLQNPMIRVPMSSPNLCATEAGCDEIDEVDAAFLENKISVIRKNK
jgi:hypothetical protein